MAAMGPMFVQERRSDPRTQLAQALMQQGASTAPVNTPLEGLARALTGITGAWQNNMVRDEYKQREDAYGKTIKDALGPDVQSDVAGGPGEQLAQAPKPRSFEQLAEVLSRNPDTAPMALQMRLDERREKAAADRALMIEREKAALKGDEVAAPKTVEAYDPSTGTKRVFGFNKASGQYDIPIGGPEQRKPDAMSPERLQQEKDLARMRADLRPDRPEKLVAIPDPSSPTGFAFGVPEKGGAAPAPKQGQMTEGQANAALYADRMTAADRIIADPALTTAAMDYGNRLASGLLPNLASNAIVSKDFQKFDQARRDFVNAVLRRESGAVISDAEFENANKQYFPQPGDKPEVLAQKAANRQTAIDGIKRAAGGNYKPLPQSGGGWSIQKVPGG